MRLAFLGTGGGWPSKERNVSSIGVQMGKDVVLLDCGEGTQRQIQHTTMSFMRISRILITHFHGDHFLGLSGLIQSMSLNDREKPIWICGPTGTVDFVNAMMGIGYFHPTFRLDVQEFDTTEELDCGDYTIKAVDTNHGCPSLAYAIQEKLRPGKFDKKRALQIGIPEGPAFGRLQKGESVQIGTKTFTPDMVMGPQRQGRKLVYSGDTRPCPQLVGLAEDADVLIHEATLAGDLEEKARDYGHSTPSQAAQVALEAGARSLYLTHFSPRYEDTDTLVQEAREIFENTHAATDLEEFDIKVKSI